MHHNNITITLYFVSSHTAPVNYLHPQHSDPMLTAIFCKRNVPLTYLLRPMDVLDYTAASVLLQTTLPIMHHCSRPLFHSMNLYFMPEHLQEHCSEEGEKGLTSTGIVRAGVVSDTVDPEPNSTHLKDKRACADTHTILLSHLHQPLRSVIFCVHKFTFT